MREALAALVLAAVLGGCGGGDGASFDAGPVEPAKPGTRAAVGERLFVRYAGLGAEMEPRAKSSSAATTPSRTVRSRGASIR